jgi:uncharacterized membrane-anchored protein YitT (DUF2179 family)
MNGFRRLKPLRESLSDIPYRSILFNCSLIVAGSIVFIIGMNSILVPQKLLSGGLIGVVLIIHYLISSLDIGLGYFLLNIPLLLLGWFHVSRRFMFYSIFGMMVFSLLAKVIQPAAVQIKDPILAALLAGVICGAGAGIILRSLGSAGGLDILAVYLGKRFGLRPGAVFMAANGLILLVGAYFFNIELVLYSLIYVYTNSRVVDLVVSGFNRRKALLIVSRESAKIAHDILHRVNRGVTYLKGTGAYTGEELEVIFTVTTLTELPRMKDIVFNMDPDAFMVVNDTLEVLGKRHGTRRVY